MRIATNDMLVITNGTVFVSAHRVQIATGQQYVKAPLANFVSAHRVQIATFNPISITHWLNFASAHRVQIATLPVEHAGVHRILCLSAPRADRNTCRGPEQTPDGTLPQRTACRSQRGQRAAGEQAATLSQRTACRSQRQMCIKHRVRICGMRCKSVDSFSQHEDLLRADYFPELFCYQSSLRCH